MAPGGIVSAGYLPAQNASRVFQNALQREIRIAGQAASTIFAVMFGLVLSIFSGTEIVAAFPTWSAAVPVTIWFAPSLLTVTGAGHEAIPDVASEHVNFTTTSVLFQPKLFATGL